MRLSQFISGLQILLPHYNGGDGYAIGAEHDQVYAFATDTPLSESEVQQMRGLGWSQPANEEDDPYDAQEGWSTCV